MFLHPKALQPSSAARAERARILLGQIDESYVPILESVTSVGPEAPEIEPGTGPPQRIMITATDQARSHWVDSSEEPLSWTIDQPSSSVSSDGWGVPGWGAPRERYAQNWLLHNGNERNPFSYEEEQKEEDFYNEESMISAELTHQIAEVPSDAPEERVVHDDYHLLARESVEAVVREDLPPEIPESTGETPATHVEETQPETRINVESHLVNVVPVVTSTDAYVEHHKIDIHEDTQTTTALIEHHNLEVHEETKSTTATVLHHDVEVTEDTKITTANVLHHDVDVQEDTVTTTAHVLNHRVDVKEDEKITAAHVLHHRVDVQEDEEVTEAHVLHHRVDVKEDEKVTAAHVLHHRVDVQEDEEVTEAYVLHHRVDVKQDEEVTEAYVLHHSVEVKQHEEVTEAHVLHHDVDVKQDTVTTAANVAHHAVRVIQAEKQTAAKVEHHSVSVDEEQRVSTAKLQHHKVLVDEQTRETTAQVESLSIKVERQPVVIPVTVPEVLLALIPQGKEGRSPVLLSCSQLESMNVSSQQSAPTRTDSSALGSPFGESSDIDLDLSSPPPSPPGEPGGGGDPGDPRGPPGGPPPQEPVTLDAWKREVTRRMADVSTIDELHQFIDWVKDYACPEWTEDTPRPLIHIIRQNNCFVGVGRYGCTHCDHEFDSSTARDRHHARTHPTANPFPLSACLETITQRKLRWKVSPLQGDGAAEWKTVCRCSFPECTYVGTTLSSLKSHVRSSHPEFNELEQKIGTLWALLCHSALVSSELLTKEDMISPTVACLCSCCRWFVGKDRSAVSKHASKQHPDHPVEGQQVLAEGVSVRPHWLDPADDVEPLRQAEERIQTDQTRMNNIRAAAAQQVHANLPQQLPEVPNEERRRRQERERRIHERRRQIENPAFPPSSSDPSSDSSDSSEPEAAPPPRESLRRRAEQWIEACEHDEQEPIYLPKIWGEKARKLLPKLRLTFDGEIQALLDECEAAEPPEAEEEWIILEGLIAKISLTIRERIRELTNMAYDDQRGRRRPVVREATTIHRCIPSIRHVIKFFSNIEMMRHLRRKRMEDDNVVAGLLEQTVRILELLPEELITAIGGRGAQQVEELVQEVEDHREDRLDYLRAQFLAFQRRMTAPKSKAYQQLVQKMYQEDPGRALDWFVFSEPSPECQIPIEEVADAHRDKWETPVLADDALWDEFPLTRRMREEDNERLNTMLQDPELIQQAISSRSNLSAQGVDGICNGAWKANPKITVRIVQQILRLMLKHSKAPEAWKRLKTILLYKKGDPEDVSSWRPITLSPTLYRITMCHIARVLQTLNVERPLISPQQKGFVKTPSGITEHTQMLQEYTCDACRQRKSLYLAFIDLRDAFGSLPHCMIRDSLKLKGFTDEFTNMIMAVYENSHTQFRRHNHVSQPVGLHRGVKQGCPLSPTLFNMAIDGLINTLAQSEEGYRLGEEIVSVQAYADDIVIISDTEQGLQSLLDKVTRFCELSRLSINPAKCATLSYTSSGDRRMISAQPFKIAGENIPPLTLMSATDYLGIYIGARSHQRRQHIMRRIESVHNNCTKLSSSPLKFTQKCDAYRRFLAPQLEYEMLAGICPQKALRTLDKNIRNMFQRELGAQGLPTELFYLDWRNGGLSFTELDIRARVLTIHAFMSLHDSSSPKTGELFRYCCSDETEHRHLQRDNESPTLGIQWTRQSGTSSLLTRTVKALNRLNLGLNKVDGKWILKDLLTEREQSVDRHNFLQHVKEILQQRYCKNIDEKPLKGHSFESIRQSTVSNFWIQSKAPTSDSLVRFALRARTNSYFTREVAHHANPDNNPDCPLCGGNESLMHILNGCPHRKAKFVPRHNAIARELIQMLRSHPTFQGIIHQDSTLRSPRGGRLAGPQGDRHLRPDLWWWQDNTLHVAEITVPYANLTIQGRAEPISTLELRRVEKEEKYRELIEESQRQFNCEARLHVIVVSSLGAVPKKTLDSLKALAHTERSAMLTAKRMAIAAIRESMKIYLDFGQDHEIEDEANGRSSSSNLDSGADSEEAHPEEPPEPEEDDPAVPRWADERIRDLFRDQARMTSETTDSDDEADRPVVAV